jgi:DNA-binding NarL/FixJ family response regulator
MNRASAPSPVLSGRTILVVEDEYYLAMDIREGIEQAGGRVQGPCGDAATGLAELDRETPDCAVLDINLGQGPSFEIAEELTRRRVPFVFLTGYDAPAIPPGLAGVERIEKPADGDRVVDAVARLIGASD